MLKFGVPVVIIALLFSVIFCFSSSLNAEERLSYENCLTLKSMMKDPDSFKLYDSIGVLKMTENGKTKRYNLIVYGGANSYGAMSQNQAIFLEKEYIMNKGDDAKEAETTSQAKKMNTAIIDMLQYKVGDITHEGDDFPTFEWIDVDVEKIKKKLKLEE